MKFVEHSVYLVRDIEPSRLGEQSQYFEAFEVLEYKGQYIVYGELRHDQVNLTRGIYGTPEKPVAFPVFPHASQSELANLIVMMGGKALGISEAPNLLLLGGLKQPIGAELLLPNCNKRLAEIWGGKPWLFEPKRPNRDGLIRKCSRQIDAYLDRKRLGYWATWFLDDRAKARKIVARN